MNPLPSHQPWWQPYVELLFWIAVAMGLMLFSANQPSLDDTLKGVVIGVIIAAWSQVTSKITEIRTRIVVKNEEREKTERYLKSTLSERIGEPITNDTVVRVAEEVTKEISNDTGKNVDRA